MKFGIHLCISPILTNITIRQTWNISMHNTKYNCRVCGLNQGFEPWEDDGESPTYAICSCCGVEFGYEDCTSFATKKYRDEWLKNGAKWFSPKDKPNDWSLDKQLQGIPDEFK